MADKKISALTAASLPLAGTEVLPIVQSSATVKVASNDLTVKNIRSNATTGILQIAGPAASSTRTMTVPDANFTAARTDAAQSFTGAQTFSNQTLSTISVGTIAASGNSTITLYAGPGVTRQIGIDVSITGYENTNGGAIYMKAQVIAGWSGATLNRYGIGTTNYNESLGANDYRAYSGASLSLGTSGDDLRMTITNSGSSSITTVVVNLQISYS